MTSDLCDRLSRMCSNEPGRQYRPAPTSYAEQMRVAEIDSEDTADSSFTCPVPNSKEGKDDRVVTPVETRRASSKMSATKRASRPRRHSVYILQSQEVDNLVNSLDPVIPLRQSPPALKRSGTSESNSNQSTVDSLTNYGLRLPGIGGNKLTLSNESVNPPVRSRRFSSVMTYTDLVDNSSPKVSLQRSQIVPQHVLEEGRDIREWYEIEGDPVGKGSYGSVYRARERATGVLRAIKKIEKSRLRNVIRLKREILVMKNLIHPYIIRLFELFEDAESLYMVMEICSGGELFDRIVKNGHLSERNAAIIVKQVLQAIGYSHGHDIVHRDLKPENLLFSDTSPTSVIKVIDWGFASLCSPSQQFCSVVGTPYYVAPEVLRGNYGSKCDIWSLGVITYILLCGYPPFHGESSKKIIENVKKGHYSFDGHLWSRISDKAKNLVSQMLCMDPRLRPSARECLQHPWFQCLTCVTSKRRLSILSSKPSPTTDMGIISSDLIERFTAFRNMNKFKKLVMQSIAYQTTEEDVGELSRIFASLDNNGTGRVPIADLAATMRLFIKQSPAELDNIVTCLDTDGSGLIDYVEFLSAAIDVKQLENKHLVRAAFKLFDSNGDGKITAAELQRIVHTNGDNLQESAWIVNQIFQEADADSKGYLTYTDFLAHITQSSTNQTMACTPSRRQQGTHRLINMFS